ncbi:type I phosphatidylinositol 4,5-bisphosphate 4-phosphatase-A [Adelges cooleyi]|uniref:type I phosphatidylinositol 4,5-bisphosphate 4-phosphatase-A n=1 Tax=Adelges cooleyi TaxID=133065 RepID=UPI0021803425|nr:type I phosphatidylinositol 4,5-bisphosphate 4-phosphatase-A [Adelges cooleyi]XP_050438419.1 type I phosphatidylinositol 4,5-bisphosphate 4-phosphatase-A [Adelges cooleyi]
MADDKKVLLNSEEEFHTGGSQTNNSDSPTSSIIDSGTVPTTNIISDGSTDYTVPEMGPENSATKVTCRVCQEMIDVLGKKEQHVVKCNRCNEATPIRSAPAGKKYVRCLCHCLLICKSSSQRIACPRANCKRVINLAPSPVTPPVPQVPGMCRVTCVHCQDTFLFNMLQNALARCPHCRKVSSVGPEFARAKAIFFFILAIVLLIVGGIVLYFTYSLVMDHTSYLILYIALLVFLLVALWKCLYYYRIKVSSIDGPV